ncbi:hypothetical protein SDC9_150792 [bioreactor metagenome]|uniref:Uncharacterized protein n=1 Tax=bioreactor metagenome TaxID=1076179 RepID=A0A645ENH8_9ZZZZ
MDDLQHALAILAVRNRGCAVTDAVDEMRQLLRITLVKRLFKHRERPARRRARLLAGVVVALEAVHLRGVALEQVGVGNALVAVDFNHVLHAAVLGPAVLADAENGFAVALELDLRNRVILRVRIVHDLEEVPVDVFHRRALEHP